MLDFSQDVAARSQGKRLITVHDNAPLYKGSEIERAVQGGQALIEAYKKSSATL